MALAWVASLVPTYGYTKPVCHPNPGPCEGPYINIATFTVLFHVVEYVDVACAHATRSVLIIMCSPCTVRWCRCRVRGVSCGAHRER